jgi:uncharacterized membrane protein
MSPATAFLAPLGGAPNLASLRLSHSLSRRPPAPPRRHARVAPPICKLIQASVPVTVEAPRSLVFALFSDLERMPEWSSTLESVTRVVDTPDMTEWTFSWRGVRLGWKARDTERVELQRIAWTAVSGVVHDGCVDFADESGGRGTSITMSVEFDAGVLSSILDSRVLGPGIMRFVEGALESDLQRFRQFVLRVQRRERIKAQRSS